MAETWTMLLMATFNTYCYFTSDFSKTEELYANTVQNITCLLYGYLQLLFKTFLSQVNEYLMKYKGVSKSFQTGHPE